MAAFQLFPCTLTGTVTGFHGTVNGEGPICGRKEIAIYRLLKVVVLRAGSGIKPLMIVL